MTPDQPVQTVVIVGGGLAGSLLAARLGRAGVAVHLFDDGAPAAASRVAAGLYNVITGRFGAKTWLAETLLAELEAFLALPEMAPLRAYRHPGLIYRPFREVAEYNKWSSRTAEPDFAALVALQETPLLPDRIDNPLGGIRILPCGWMDVAGFIDGLHEVLVRDLGVQLYRERLAYAQLDPAQRRVHMGPGAALTYDALVFAEGAAMAGNPWLPGLKLIPNKGELLEIHAPALDMPFVLSKKIYLVPLGEDRYGVGATYANRFDSPEPSAAGRAEICGHLDRVLKVPYTVTGHWAGLRPTTPNRRPIVGPYPGRPGLYVLTGFGTKGVLLAPWCSRLLASHLLGTPEAIPAEAEASRFG